MEIHNCNPEMSEKEKWFRDSLFAQLEEIMKYKWCMGERMKRDPLECMSMDQICIEWIEKHAPSFRDYWNSKHQTGSGRIPANICC